MLIRRLDAFFRTQLVLQDTSNFCNSATNVAFAAIQHLIGQKRYECLNGRVTLKAAPDSTLPNPYYKTLLKIAVWIGAFCLVPFLTPIGILTRHLSLRSPEIDQVYSLALISQVPASGRTSSMFGFLCKKPEAKRHALLKELPQEQTISFLSQTSLGYSVEFLLKLSEPECTDLLMKLPLHIQVFFLCPKSQHKYALQFLLKLPALSATELLMKLPESVQTSYLSVQAEELKKAPKKKALNNQLTSSISFLSKLSEKKDKSSVESVFKEAFNSPFYPYPFLFAEKLQSNPALRDLIDPALFSRFSELHTNCCKKLDDVGFADHRQEETRQKKIQAESKGVLSSAFRWNKEFFSELETFFQKSDVQTVEIKEWLEKQKASPKYFYPFTTYPRVLELMKKLAPDISKIQPFLTTYTSCITFLKEKDLAIEEAPSPDLPLIQTLMGAMDQLENISNFQSLINTQPD